MKAFNESVRKQFGRLASTFSLSEKWDRRQEADDPDEHGQPVILTSGLEPHSRLPNRKRPVADGSL